MIMPPFAVGGGASAMGVRRSGCVERGDQRRRSEVVGRLRGRRSFPWKVSRFRNAADLVGERTVKHLPTKRAKPPAAGASSIRLQAQALGSDRDRRPRRAPGGGAAARPRFHTEGHGSSGEPTHRALTEQDGGRLVRVGRNRRGRQAPQRVRSPVALDQLDLGRLDQSTTLVELCGRCAAVDPAPRRRVVGRCLGPVRVRGPVLVPGISLYGAAPSLQLSPPRAGVGPARPPRGCDSFCSATCRASTRSATSSGRSPCSASVPLSGSLTSRVTPATRRRGSSPEQATERRWRPSPRLARARSAARGRARPRPGARARRRGRAARP
jgi:hypothetical protein